MCYRLATGVERAGLLALQCAGCEPCKVGRFAEGLQGLSDMQRAWQSRVGLRGQQSIDDVTQLRV